MFQDASLSQQTDKVQQMLHSNTGDAVRAC